MNYNIHKMVYYFTVEIAYSVCNHTSMISDRICNHTKYDCRQNWTTRSPVAKICYILNFSTV